MSSKRRHALVDCDDYTNHGSIWVAKGVVKGFAVNWGAVSSVIHGIEEVLCVPMPPINPLSKPTSKKPSEVRTLTAIRRPRPLSSYIMTKLDIVNALNCSVVCLEEVELFNVGKSCKYIVDRGG